MPDFLVYVFPFFKHTLHPRASHVGMFERRQTTISQTRMTESISLHHERWSVSVSSTAIAAVLVAAASILAIAPRTGYMKQQ